MTKRYEIRTGKFGQYFYDSKTGKDMPLDHVLELLNSGEIFVLAYENWQNDSIDDHQVSMFKSYLLKNKARAN